MLARLPDHSAAHCPLRTIDLEKTYGFSQKLFLSWKRIASVPFLMMHVSVMPHSLRRCLVILFSHVTIAATMRRQCCSFGSKKCPVAYSRRYLPLLWISDPGPFFKTLPCLIMDCFAEWWTSTSTIILVFLVGERINYKYCNSCNNHSINLFFVYLFSYSMVKNTNSKTSTVLGNF